MMSFFAGEGALALPQFGPTDFALAQMLRARASTNREAR
jgi:hypothetical protein